MEIRCIDGGAPGDSAAVMRYRQLGKSGLQLSALSLGSYVTFGSQVDDAAAVDLMREAYDAGVNFFDNAEGYAAGESERIMGRALRELGWRRDSFAVSSKVFFGTDPQGDPLRRGLHRKHVVEACDQALERLQVDYLDLYFCHRPDPHTPVEETVRAMHELVMRGKVFYWGTSEWPAKRIREAFEVAREHHLTPPTMEQPQYNMIDRTRVELEYAHLFERFGLGTTIWGPLRSGILTGKYADGVPESSRLGRSDYEASRSHLSTPAGERMLRAVAEVARVAESLGATPAQLAIAWCLANPHVSTVLLGASSVEQLRENLGALDVVDRIDASVLRSIERCLAPLPRHRLLRVPGGRALARTAYALGLR